METIESHKTIMQPRAQELQSKLSKISKMEELLILLRHDKLTTPVQWFFIRQELDNMHQFADLLQNNLNSLLKGCKMIIEEKR
ncbi:MAG TPA: hypothetical protein VIM65_06235 [Cyclobacteriaceae bacterium]